MAIRADSTGTPKLATRFTVRQRPVVAALTTENMVRARDDDAGGMWREASGPADSAFIRCSADEPKPFYVVPDQRPEHFRFMDWFQPAPEETRSGSADEVPQRDCHAVMNGIDSSDSCAIFL